MKKHWIAFVVTCICGLLLVGYIYHNRSTPQVVVRQQVIDVQTQVATIQNLPTSVRVMGNIIADDNVELRARAAGVVTTVNFYSGQRVEANQILVTLENTQQYADLVAANAELDKITAHFDRIRRLYENSQAVSTQVFEQTKAEYARAEANAKMAQFQYDNTFIRAPFDGVLTARDVDVGQYLTQGEAIVTLVDLNKLSVDYVLSERYLGDIKLGQRVIITSSAYGGERFEAKVHYIAPLVSSTSLSLNVRATLDTNAHLRPGMSVNVEQILNPDHQALVVPEKAIHVSHGGFVVYVVENNTARAQAVTLGQISQGLVEITSGLSQGDVVVVQSSARLSDGVNIKVQA